MSEKGREGMSASSSHDHDVEHNEVFSRRRFLGLSGASLAALAAGLGMEPEEMLAALAARSRPKNGGTVTVGLSNESPNMDPHQASDYITAMIDSQIFDTLVNTLANHKVVPGLATSWHFSSDHKQVTFKLRKGVKFHDGAPFNAEAMKISFDRMVNPA